MVVMTMMIGGVNAFVPAQQSHHTLNQQRIQQPPTCSKHSLAFRQNHQQENRLPHSITQRQRRSVASIQTASLFGLGVPELALIAVAAIILIGPSNLAGVVKDSGKAAGEFSKELKKVPEEFQKGLEEGEAEARSRKAKKITPMKDDDDESSE